MPSIALNCRCVRVMDAFLVIKTRKSNVPVAERLEDKCHRKWSSNRSTYTDFQLLQWPIYTQHVQSNATFSPILEYLFVNNLKLWNKMGAYCIYNLERKEKRGRKHELETVRHSHGNIVCSWKEESYGNS